MGGLVARLWRTDVSLVFRNCTSTRRPKCNHNSPWKLRLILACRKEALYNRNLQGPRLTNQRKIIDVLVKQRAQIINTRDAKGLTPLHIAVRSGNAQVVKKLVDLGADVGVVKAKKRVPLNWNS